MRRVLPRGIMLIGGKRCANYRGSPKESGGRTCSSTSGKLPDRPMAERCPSIERTKSSGKLEGELRILDYRGHRQGSANPARFPAVLVAAGLEKYFEEVCFEPTSALAYPRYLCRRAATHPTTRLGEPIHS